MILPLIAIDCIPWQWREDRYSVSSTKRNFIGLVDDEEDLAYLFKDALSRKGFVVNVFTDPVAALESISAEHFRYRLVLTDISMPKLNGLQLASRINDLDKEIKLILMSAYDLIDIPSALPHEFLQKPIHIEKLKEIVFCTAILLNNNNSEGLFSSNSPTG
jgi:DNA-binding NtrC family response regulator